jgi:hypothetical protein
MRVNQQIASPGFFLFLLTLEGAWTSIRSRQARGTAGVVDATAALDAYLSM